MGQESERRRENNSNREGLPTAVKKQGEAPSIPWKKLKKRVARTTTTTTTSISIVVAIWVQNYGSQEREAWLPPNVTELRARMGFFRILTHRRSFENPKVGKNGSIHRPQGSKKRYLGLQHDECEAPARHGRLVFETVGRTEAARGVCKELLVFMSGRFWQVVRKCPESEQCRKQYCRRKARMRNSAKL